MFEKRAWIGLATAVAFAAIALWVGSAQAATHEVHLMDFKFTPQNVTINVGDTVHFTNMDPHDHDVTFEVGPGSGGAGSLVPDEEFNRTFDTAGTFVFRCTLHSSNFTDGMIGKITVRAPVPAADVYVELKNLVFSPATITIQPGDTVTWINNETFAHDILFEAGFGTGGQGSMDPAGTFSHTFATNGTFKYRCQLHSGTFDSGMVGVVVVGDGGVTPPPAPGFLPGFEAPLVAMALLAAVGVAAAVRRERP